MFQCWCCVFVDEQEKAARSPSHSEHSSNVAVELNVKIEQQVEVCSAPYCQYTTGIH